MDLWGAAVSIPRALPVGLRAANAADVRDACREVHRRQGAGGLLAFWLPSLLDLIKTALAERLRQGKLTMAKERWLALAGLLTIVIGVLWLAASGGELVLLFGLASPATFWDVFWLLPIALSFILMIPALIVTWLRHHAAAGVPGRLGLLLSIAGCMGMWGFVLAGSLMDLAAPAFDDGEWPNYVIAACFVSIMLGHLLFGVDALRRRLLLRRNALPLPVGLPTVLLSVSTLLIERVPPADSHAVLITNFRRFALTGLGWVLLGLVLLDPKPASQPMAAT